MADTPVGLTRSTIEPQYLAIHVTYRCPARCSHCCFSSDIFKTGNLPVEIIKRAIDEASNLPSLRLVGFTGGDPFLHREILASSIAHAKERGLRTRVVTSAYWATSSEKAIDVLRPLAVAGLDEMTISFDDAHAPHVPEDYIINAYRATVLLKVQLGINVCREPGSRINRKYVTEMLGLDGNTEVRIVETWINSTGRAADEASLEQRDSRKGAVEARLSPCEHVLRGPTVTPSGKLLPCCGTIPFRSGLQIGDVYQDRVDYAISRAYNNLVLKWIAFEGPAEILKQITASSPHPLTDEDFDGNCHACDVLFSSPEYQRLLQAALPDKEPSLRLQEVIYSAVGLYQPPTLGESQVQGS
jgi:hypothetical protein